MTRLIDIDLKLDTGSNETNFVQQSQSFDVSLTQAMKAHLLLDKLNKPSIHDDNQFLLCMNERMVTFEYHVS
uniref:Uncharacterized protein n=1 Tax=Romanomermis culicivorax TaxID=13658 RepID=A0A915JB63_ROMCU